MGHLGKECSSKGNSHQRAKACMGNNEEANVEEKKGRDKVTDVTRTLRTMGRTLSFPEKARSYGWYKQGKVSQGAVWPWGSLRGAGVEAGRPVGRPLPQSCRGMVVAEPRSVQGRNEK